MDVKIYKSSNNQSLKGLLGSIFKGMADGQLLAYRLFRRDLKASFEASILGLTWLFIPALAAAGIWILLNQQRVISVSSGQMVYPAYVLIGTTMWNIFAEALNKPVQRYKLAMSMMVKLNFPREALFLASFYDMVFSVLIKLLVLLPLLLFIGLEPNWYWLMTVLISFGVVFTGLALGLFISPIGLLFNDVSRGINVVLPFIMFLTPVVYSIPEGSFMHKAQAFNPITPWIELCRSSIGNYAFEMTTPLLVWTLISAAVLFLGLVVMRIALPIIVERSGT
jgi:lipopolysaccharide transport system permease protein